MKYLALTAANYTRTAPQWQQAPHNTVFTPLQRGMPRLHGKDMSRRPALLHTANR